VVRTQNGGHKTGLRSEARRMVKSLQVRPANLEELFQVAKRYNDMEDSLDYTLDYGNWIGAPVDMLDVDEVRDLLNQIEESLLKYEQDPDLRREAISEVRRTFAPQDGDDKTVAIALLVDPISFGRPQGRLLTMLTRSMACTTRIDQRVIFDGPYWLVRWINQQTKPAGIEVVSVHDSVADREILSAATELWEPLRPQSPFKAAATAIETAKKLL